MDWNNYLRDLEGGNEPGIEKDYEDPDKEECSKSILDYQSMTNEELLKELADIRSTLNDLKELQEIEEYLDLEDAFKILIERYKMIKTIIERKRNC